MGVDGVLDDRKRKGFTVVQISAGGRRPDGRARCRFDSEGKPNERALGRHRGKVREANRLGIVVLVVGVGHPTTRRISTREYARIWPLPGTEV